LCFLQRRLVLQKEYLSFGVYSCDWTSMDNTFLKRMLFEMRMHSKIDHNIIIVTPTKYVGLPMLAAVCIQLHYKIYSIEINQLCVCVFLDRSFIL